MTLPRAPRGELAAYARSDFEHGGLRFDLFTRGAGPVVLVLTEIPGISPQVIGFADRLVAAGFTAVMPNLFGTAGRDPEGRGGRLYAAATLAGLCVRREFTMFATNRTSPVVEWLRALGRELHARHGGPGIGVVGMCFTGGFALAMATEPSVLLPVMSQPGLPAGLPAAKRDAGCSADDLACIAARKDLQVVGLRFHADPLSPAERFATLRQALGERFIAVELQQRDGHPDSPLRPHHSVLTGSLIDEPGQPTHDALELVLRMLREKLVP
jgi:dienelactone hydrolase